jgi:hypothetical protein
MKVENVLLTLDHDIEKEHYQVPYIDQKFMIKLHIQLNECVFLIKKLVIERLLVLESIML